MKENRAIKKTLIAFLFFITLTIPKVYGFDMVIIPITFYEMRGTNFIQGNNGKNITKDIENQLSRYYNVRISMEQLSDQRAGATDFDAKRTADRYQVNEVLYGALRQNGSQLSAEIRIFSLQNEQIKQIFASDSNEMYERLVNTLCAHVFDWYRTNIDKVDLLRNEVRDLRAEINAINEKSAEKVKLEKAKARLEAIENVNKTFSLKVPISVGYWSYVENEWAEIIQETVEVTTGIRMYPKLQFPEIFNMKNELSLGLRLGYRNGVTGTRNNLIMNGILINPSLGYHFNVYSNNYLSLCAGMFFELGFWEIEDQGESIHFQQTLTGYTLGLDYSYQFNRMFSVNFGVDFYGYFTQGSSTVVKTYFGTVITVLGGNND